MFQDDSVRPSQLENLCGFERDVTPDKGKSDGSPCSSRSTEPPVTEANTPPMTPTPTQRRFLARSVSFRDDVEVSAASFGDDAAPIPRRHSAPAQLWTAPVVSRLKPKEVGKRLKDLLLDFPGAAIEGVPWHVLEEAYKQRHGTDDVLFASVTLSRFGSDAKTEYSAALMLLWDVIRPTSVKGELALVAVDDEVALSSSPGRLATWPALYRKCCEAVFAEGSQDGIGFYGLPLAEVRPELRRFWSANFFEGRLSFMDGDSAERVAIDDLSDLVLSLIEWRAQRVEWQQTSGHLFGAVDSALTPVLELFDVDGTPWLFCQKYRVSLRSGNLAGLKQEVDELSALNETDAI